jgi:hypothetical protein
MEMTLDDRARKFNEGMEDLKRTTGIEMVAELAPDMTGLGGALLVKPVMRIKDIPGWQPPPAEESETET